MASVITSYGLLLAGFACLISPKTQDVGKVVVWLCLVVGAIFVILGVAAWTGYKKRHWLVISQLSVVVVLLNTTFDLWFSKRAGTDWLSMQLPFTAMLILGMGMLLYLFHGERSPEFYRRTPQDESQVGTAATNPRI